VGEGERGGEREGKGEPLEDAQRVAIEADAEGEGALLSLSAPLWDAEGEPVTAFGLRVEYPIVAVCVGVRDCRGEVEKEVLVQPLRETRAEAEAQADCVTPDCVALPEGLRDAAAEAVGTEGVGAPLPLRLPVPPVTVPDGVGSAVGMVVTTAEADTVMLGEGRSEAEGAGD
jgi:hypothetical protein